jgi:transposase
MRLTAHVHVANHTANAAFAWLQGLRRRFVVRHSRPTSITPMIAPKANRKMPRICGFALYCERNLVERFFNKLEHFRVIATLYNKLAKVFLAGVQFASAIIFAQLKTTSNRKGIFKKTDISGEDREQGQFTG